MAAPAARVAALAANTGPVHRAMLRLPVDRRGLVAGMTIALLVAGAALAFARPFWRAEAEGVSRLLSVSGTPHQVRDAPPASHFGGLRTGGPRVHVAVERTTIPAGAAAAITVAIVGATFGVLRWRRIPLPLKVLWLAAAAVGVISVLHTSWTTTGPPHRMDHLVVDFQSSGLLIMIVASLLFAFEVFPIPGRLRTKVAWLGALFAFATAWSVVRMALALATASRFGTWPFMFLHYAGGIYVDFLYVVAFYSFATHSLARRPMTGGERA